MRQHLLQFKFEFGNVVIRQRLKAGLSQWELAKKSEVNPKLIEKIEAGLANPTLKQMHKICKALEIAIEFLYLEN